MLRNEPELVACWRKCQSECGLASGVLSSGRPNSATGLIMNESAVDVRLRSEYGDGADEPPIISKRQTQS